ncbi:MAG: hypothetical protein KBD78_05935 [Oligoflexales bacterium]|nr:hypothetical protein [Oligoflexales bacterium]
MFRIIEQPNSMAVLAPRDFSELTAEELSGSKFKRFERLFFLEKKIPQKIYWQENIWLDPVLIEFDSVKDCAMALKSMQRSWWPYFYDFFRRGELIQEALPHVSAKPLDFGAVIAQSPLGSWTLLDKNRALAAKSCSSQRPNGEWYFMEDMYGPPSRAYLKLWEALSRIGVKPNINEICIELGASPGGWAWVLKNIAAKVIAYDRSPLREDLMQNERIEFRSGDAFAVDLNAEETASWLFSDLACYPDKLYEFIQNKLLKSSIKKAICTIKLQGKGTHLDVIRRFEEIPGSEVLHLTANKHEMTWFYGVN